MSAPLLRLSGVGEGIEICIETTLKGADSPTKVADSIVKLFPEFPKKNSSSKKRLSN